MRSLVLEARWCQVLVLPWEHWYTFLVIQSDRCRVYETRPVVLCGTHQRMVSAVELSLTSGSGIGYCRLFQCTQSDRL